MTFSRPVVVAGVGFSEVARHAGRPAVLLTIEAVHRALEDAGIPLEEVDGLSTYPLTPHLESGRIDGIDEASVHLVARHLRVLPRIRWFAQPDALFQSAFVEAVNAVAAGASEVCVVYRTMHNPAGRYNPFTGELASGLHQFSLPYGLFRAFHFYGGVYHRYLHEYGATREHMATFVVNDRLNAALNPHAIFRDDPLTVEDYLGARMIAEPLCLLDCDYPVDGAVALVVTSAARAQDLPVPVAHVAGYSQFVGSAGYLRSSALRMGPPLADFRAESTALVDRLWVATGLDPADVSVLQVYDGYSLFVYLWLEAAGFCGEGEAFEFIQGGRIARDGELPLNTFGGQLGEGRLHGAGHLAEAALQAAGRAGARQVPGVTTSLALVGSGVDDSVAVAFTSEPR